MLFSATSVAAVIAAFAAATTARIVGLAAPAVIAPNDNITVTLITENYIQSVRDLSTAFALAPQVFEGGFLGVDYLGSFYLGPDRSNVLNNLTFTVTTPADLSGVQYLTGIVNSLYGVSNGATTVEFAVPVTPGNTTSTTQNADRGGINGNCFSSSSSPSPPNSTSTPTPTPPPPPSGDPSNCFPTATQSLIQQSLLTADALIGSIAQSNNATGPQNLGQLRGLLADLFRAIDVADQGEAACGNPSPPPAWPPLSPEDSRIRAIQILRDAQSALQVVSSDVLACETAEAFEVVCEVLRLVDEVGGYYGSS